MWELYEEIWDEQIGYKALVGHDFSGREIHREDFRNPNSAFGWTLLPFGDNESFLVVHNETMGEFPDDISEEFFINGKIFEIKESESGDGSLEINEISYETTQDRDYRINQHNAAKAELERQRKQLEEEPDDETDTFSFSEKKQIKQQPNFGAKAANFNNKEKMTTTSEQDLIIYNLNQKFQLQEQELNALKENQKTQELKILEQKKQIMDLEKSASLSYDVESKTNEVELLRRNDNNNWNTQQLTTNVTNLVSPAHQQLSSNNSLTTNLSSANFQLSSQSNHENLVTKQLTPTEQWEKEFGDKPIALDFSGRMMIKTEFGKNVDGGWAFDNYTSDEKEGFYISSLYAISQRAGKSEFKVDDKEFKIVDENGKKKIVDKNKIPYSVYSKEKINTKVISLAPGDAKKFNGTYESYASILINLNHFPIDYLDKFESFLKEMLKDLPVYKDYFIYLNKRAYENGSSNITSYARVFLKFASTKEEIEILIISLSLKNALIKFVNNYRSKNNRFVVSFSMVLSNHRGQFKFIQAQTNYDILRNRPVPFKIPLYKLILDEEFNSVLQYHENELWKKLRPFALDHAGQKYYICDVDPEEYVEELNNQQG